MSQFKQRTNNNGSKAEGTKASTLHIADLAPDLTQTLLKQMMLSMRPIISARQ